MKPYLSVIFCTYNREKYLYNALKSIAEQAYPTDKYEIVLINNNSTDNTEGICQQFAIDYPSINFRYLIETHQGLSHARNRGVEESRGDILVFVDDDATVFDGYLSTIERFFLRNTSVAACGGPIVPVYESGKPDWISPFTNALIGGALDEGKLEKPFKNGKYPGGGNSAFQRRVFEVYGSFNPALGRKGNNLIGAEEKDLYARLTRGGELFYYLPTMGIYHYIPDSKLTNAHFKNLTYSIGKSERIRTKSESNWSYFKRIISETIKWFASIVLFVYYLVTFRYTKGIKLLQFRWNVTRGLFSSRVIN